MADINVERKGPSIWPWIIGLIVLALLIWALVELFEGDDDDVVTTPTTEQPTVVEPAPDATAPATTVTALPVAEVAQDPQGFEGRTVSGEVTVAEVVGDDAFWIEDQGQRLLLLVRNTDTTQPLQVQAGDRIHITEARVMSTDDLSTVAADVGAEARQSAEAEDVVLSTDAENIHVLSQGAAQRADPAQPM